MCEAGRARVQCVRVQYVWRVLAGACAVRCVCGMVTAMAATKEGSYKKREQRLDERRRGRKQCVAE
jgi:hypothetical protein